MAKNVTQKLHDSIVNGMSSYEVSPAGAAYKMLDESRFVNESTLQYLLNYIIVWGTRDEDHVPPYNKDVYIICKQLYRILKELGLTNTGSR